MPKQVNVAMSCARVSSLDMTFLIVMHGTGSDFLHAKGVETHVFPNTSLNLHQVQADCLLCQG